MPQYQVEDENAALKIALEQSVAKVYYCLLLIVFILASKNEGC